FTYRSIFEGNPKSNHSTIRLGQRVQIRSILMFDNLATNLGILEDNHRLYNHRITQPQRSGKLFEFLVKCESFENRIPPVKCMANFVQTSLFWNGQPSLPI